MDFANANDCTRYYNGPIQLTPDDVVYADLQGQQSKFGGPLECIMRFSARERNRGLRLFTKHFNIDDCGVTLEVYDQNVYLQTPKVRCWEIILKGNVYADKPHSHHIKPHSNK